MALTKRQRQKVDRLINRVERLSFKEQMEFWEYFFIADEEGESGVVQRPRTPKTENLKSGSGNAGSNPAAANSCNYVVQEMTDEELIQWHKGYYKEKIKELEETVKRLEKKEREK